VFAAEPVVHPLGHFRNPATSDALWQKFESCAAPSLGPAAARAMFDRLAKLEPAGSVDALLGAAVAAEVA
jgi:2-methylcitrate dehydratase PrpD